MSIGGFARRRRAATRVSTMLLVGLLALTACGQKGPLFLPDREAPVAQPPAPAPETTPESEDRDKDEEKPR